MAAFDGLTDEDAQQMRAVQSAIVAALLPFTERTPSALILLALVRCARVVLRKAPDADQREIVPVVTAYLEGKVTPPAQGGTPLLWTPGDGRPN